MVKKFQLLHPWLLKLDSSMNLARDPQTITDPLWVTDVLPKYSLWISEIRNMPGLAHFCEHLLFMGTEKYPDENHFENHVRRFGGYYNASTHEDFTRYYVSFSQSSQN